MASWMPSNIGKKLLRYLLLYSDILDPESLKLEGLNYDWGFQNSVELKDVRLNITKVSKLLQLPRNIILTDGKLLSLRIEVPTSFWSSATRVSLSGLELNATVINEEVAIRKQPLTSATSNIPLLDDVANSFLRREPEQERQKLAAAIQAQSIANEDGSSDDEDVGVGTSSAPLSGWLASAIKGIIDRLEVHIENVTFSAQFGTQDESLPDEKIASTICLNFDNLEVEGVTSRIPGDKHWAKRQIRLQNLTTSISSSSTVFERLQQASAFQSQAGTTQSTRSQPYSLPRQYYHSSYASQSSVSENSPHRLKHPSLLPHSVKDRFGDASDEEDEHEQFFNDPLPPSWSTHSAYEEEEKSQSFPFGMDASGLQQSSFAEPQHPSPSASLPDSAIFGETGPSSPAELQLSQTSTSSSNGSPNEDMLQSRFFTHEEAQSMYKSAVTNIEDSFQSQKPNLSPRDEMDTFTPIPPFLSGPEISTKPDTEPPAKKLTKELIFIDEIAILIPWSGTVSPIPLYAPTTYYENDSNLSNDPSECYNMPGGFPSSYIAGSFPEDDQFEFQSDQPEKAVHTQQTLNANQVEKEVEAEQRKRSVLLDELDSVTNRADVELLIASLKGNLDLSCGKLLLSLVEQVRHGINTSSKEPINLQAPQNDSSSSEKTIPINSFFAQISRFQVSVQEQMAVLGAAFDPLLTESTIVLESTRNQLFADLSQAEATNLTFKTHDFSLGFMDHPIVSFVSPIDFDTSNMAASTILADSTKCDIQVLFQTAPTRGPELHIYTGQLMLDFNLPSIDDKLSQYGGLSGILDISNSISSRSTILKSPSPPKMKSQSSNTKPATKDDSVSALGSLKVNSRISAMLIKFQGRSHAISIESNAILIVHRDGKLGLTAGQVWTTGPLQNSRPLISLTDLNVGLLSAPQKPDLNTLKMLINPIQNPYEDEGDIMLDILLRQRQKGSVLRFSVESADVFVDALRILDPLQEIIEELTKLQNVTKYLPEDDRPGILSLVSIASLNFDVDLGNPIGTVTVNATNAKVAHVGLPALLAIEVAEVEAWIYNGDTFTDLAKPLLKSQEGQGLPVLMAKMIGDEVEPTVKIKVVNLLLDYHVSTLMTFTGLNQNNTTTEDLAASMAMSVATIRSHLRTDTGLTSPLRGSPSSKQLCVNVILRDCGIGLNPASKPSKGLFLISTCYLLFNISPSESPRGSVDLKQAIFMAIDDANLLDNEPDSEQEPPTLGNPASTKLHSQGYKTLVTLQSVGIEVRSGKNQSSDQDFLVLDVAPKLVLIETCADSTQTLIEIIDGLKPPSVLETTPLYRTNAMLPQDLMDKFSGAEYEQINTNAEVMEAEAKDGSDTKSIVEAEAKVDSEYKSVLSDEESWDLIGSFYSTAGHAKRSSHETTQRRQALPSPPGSNGTVTKFSTMRKTKRKLAKNLNRPAVRSEPLFNYQPSKIRVWSPNQQGSSGNTPTIRNEDHPLRLNLRVDTFIWNLFDGYDWAKTREIIGEAMEKVRVRAKERKLNLRGSNLKKEEEPSEIGDTLFQSIWISIPADHDIDIDRSRYSESVTGSSLSKPIAHQKDNRAARRQGQQSKLHRSTHHHASIEVQSLDLDLKVLPPNRVETQSVAHISVREFVIYDHVPTSTWRKFLTGLRDANPRPSTSSMLYLTIKNVKPQLDLAATELIISVRVMPLRLHVDQDTLDFITRFFEFKDDTQPPGPRGEPPFIQRIEVFDVPLCLDYKPKKVNYAGLRSGRTKEFMNFITLDSADILLRHVILYGVLGFDNLNASLNEIWVGDITRRQLPTIIQGLAPLRPLVNVTRGISQLIVIPLAEYKKDGSVIRSIQKGTFAFAKQTTVGLTRLVGQVAMGTGALLTNAESLLASASPIDRRYGEDDAGHLQKPDRAKSLYAEQALTLNAALRLTGGDLEHDLTTARNAIIGVGLDLRESENVPDVLKAIRRGAPVVILRPIIAATKAIGNLMLGTGNMLDSGADPRLQDKYK